MTRRVDPLLWACLPALALWTLPVGWVSADGLGQSIQLTTGSWRWNPNHLFFEPLAAAWQALLPPSSTRAEALDHLRRLSVLAGGLALGLFRHGVARPLADGRWRANLATAAVAAGAAFSRLWLSDEAYMVQMPAVVLVAVAVLGYLERPGAGRALLVGVAVALAGVLFASNLLLAATLCVALAVRHLARGERRLAAAASLALLGGAATAGLAFAGVWLASRPGVGFLAWAASYGGGVGGQRLALAYGAPPSPDGVLVAGGRALYGAASALVDLGPAVAVLRDRQPIGPDFAGRAMAFFAAAGLLNWSARSAARRLSEPRNQAAAVLVGAWTAAVLGFGVYWDNSDAQFYLPLAVVFGVLAARPPAVHRRGAAVALAVLVTFVLVWNLGDLCRRQILYPREEILAALEPELRGAGLVVYPGYDEAEVMLGLSGARERTPTLALVALAASRAPAEGLADLQAAVAQCLAAGGEVLVVDVFDVPPRRNPWKFLRRMGYDRGSVLAALERFPLPATSRRAGPFTLRRIVPRAAPISRAARAAGPAPRAGR